MFTRVGQRNEKVEHLIDIHICAVGWCNVNSSLHGLKLASNFHPAETQITFMSITENFSLVEWY